MSKKTLVIGASENPNRYANKAVHRLVNHQHEVAAIGLREGRINGVPIVAEKVPFNNVDTITMYINPQRQPDYYDYILGLNPKRIIFNPGTENPELAQKARAANIKTVDACTLVMLATGQY